MSHQCKEALSQKKSSLIMQSTKENRNPIGDQMFQQTEFYKN